jgi:hypothetical protein
MSSPTESLAVAPALAVDALLAALGEDRLADADLQALLGAAVKRYAERLAEGGDLRAFAPGAGITATDAMMVTTAILRAVNVQLFELGMWQAWSGGR